MKDQWKWGTEDDYWVRTCAWSAPGCHPVGCGLKLHVVNNKLVGVEGDEEHPHNKGRLCVRCLVRRAHPEGPHDRRDRPLSRGEPLLSQIRLG